MNTYFDVGDERFKSREAATEQVKTWNADTTVFHVQEVANTEVTRKSAKGNIVTEVVRGGSLDGVPRIISVRQLSATYVVLDTDAKPLRHYGHDTYFATRVEAEGERAKRQSKVEKLAALTEADIKEVHVPTLADILERDADKIKDLETEFRNALEELKGLEHQASSSIASALADLETRAVALKAEAAALKAEAAKGFGVEDAAKKYRAAVKRHDEAIHLPEFEDEIREKLHNDHSSDCWPNSDCRERDQYSGELECTYEPDDEEVEEYLLENAEEFEVEEELHLFPDSLVSNKEEITVQVTSDVEKLWSCAEMRRKNPQFLGTRPEAAGKALRIYSLSLGPSSFCDSEHTWRVAGAESTTFAQPVEGIVVCDHQIDYESVGNEKKAVAA